jgi:hypothetical protein
METAIRLHGKLIRTVRSLEILLVSLAMKEQVLAKMDNVSTIPIWSVLLVVPVVILMDSIKQKELNVSQIILGAHASLTGIHPAIAKKV